MFAVSPRVSFAVAQNKTAVYRMHFPKSLVPIALKLSNDIGLWELSMALYRTLVASIVGIGGVYALSFGIERLVDYLESIVLYSVVGMIWGLAYCHFQNGVTKEALCFRQIEIFGGSALVIGAILYHSPFEIDPVMFLWFMLLSLLVACACAVYGTIWQSKKDNR